MSELESLCHYVTRWSQRDPFQQADASTLKLMNPESHPGACVLTFALHRTPKTLQQQKGFISLYGFVRELQTVMRCIQIAHPLASLLETCITAPPRQL